MFKALPAPDPSEHPYFLHASHIFNNACIQLLATGFHERKIFCCKSAHRAQAHRIDNYGSKQRKPYAPIHEENHGDHAYGNEEITYDFRVMMPVKHLKFFHIVEYLTLELACGTLIQNALGNTGKSVKDVSTHSM